MNSVASYVLVAKKKDDGKKGGSSLAVSQRGVKRFCSAWDFSVGDVDARSKNAQQQEDTRRAMCGETRQVLRCAGIPAQCIIVVVVRRGTLTQIVKTASCELGGAARVGNPAGGWVPCQGGVTRLVNIWVTYVRA
eukprot:1195379-Prorocentrum_minimum.AAC.7